MSQNRRERRPWLEGLDPPVANARDVIYNAMIVESIEWLNAEQVGLPERPPGPTREDDEVRMIETRRAAAWERPPRGVVAAIVPVNQTLLRDADRTVALALDFVRVYPSGLGLEFSLFRNPSVDWAQRTWPPGPREPMSLVVRFSDDRRAVWPSEPSSSVDDRNALTKPLLRQIAGVGTSFGHSHHFWLYPLPPDGPIEVQVEDDEFEGVGRIVLDGTAIRATAEHAVSLWD